MAGPLAARRGGLRVDDDAELPAEVRLLLADRAAARAERDWTAADTLRDRIRTLGWDPVDLPNGWTARAWLSETAAPDIASRLDEPASCATSVVLVADDYPEDLARFLAALDRHPLPADSELIIVANAPPAELAPVPGAVVLRAAARLGWADAANLGLRRAGGAIVVLVDTSVEPDGDWLPALRAAFSDETVGIAGGWGVTSGDGRHFVEAPPGEVDAVEGYCLAIRREALQATGGFDHRFRWYRNADLDLSFGVRDAGWRAVRSAPLPLLRHEHRGWNAHDADERDRLSKRNFYRFLKHWGDRRDLLLHPDEAAGD